jgi:hypothetical protein
VRVYADSSLILRLVTGESGAQQAAAEYRRLGRPSFSIFHYTLWKWKMEFGSEPFTSGGCFPRANAGE